MKKFHVVYLLLMVFVSMHTISLKAKQLSGRCTVQQGKASGIQELIQEVEKIDTKSERYTSIAVNPSLAQNDNEALGALQSREIFLLIDQSGSMSNDDADPRSDRFTPSEPNWTLWDSARVAAEGLAEVALALDKNGEVPVYFFHGAKTVQSIVAKTVPDITQAFKNQHPSGGTPLAKALNVLYKDHLKELLKKGQPFTVVTLTDGVPDDKSDVKKFFKAIVKKYKLASPEKKYLAAFSFIQMGDSKSAEKFLTDLDDNMSPSIGVDIIDTKKDNFIFGTDPKCAQDCGPLAIFRDAIFD